MPHGRLNLRHSPAWPQTYRFHSLEPLSLDASFAAFLTSSYVKVDDQPAAAPIHTAPSPLMTIDSHLPGRWHAEHAQGLVCSCSFHEEGLKCHPTWAFTCTHT